MCALPAIPCAFQTLSAHAPVSAKDETNVKAVWARALELALKHHELHNAQQAETKRAGCSVQ